MKILFENKRFIFVLVFCLVAIFAPCCIAETVKSYESLIDSRDGQSYKTVKIGSQTWMAENLNFETANSYCFENKAVNCIKYGRLYEWSMAMKACPEGWHLPTEMEWYALITYAGGEFVAGKSLKSATGWHSGGIGSDDFGFSAKPVGTRFDDWTYNESGRYAFFWSSTETEQDNAYGLYLNYYNNGAYLSNDIKKHWLSVRCLQDEILKSSSSSVVRSSSSSAVLFLTESINDSHWDGENLTDLRDRQIYKTVKIGSQIWMAENLNYESASIACLERNPVSRTKFGCSYTWNDAVNACPVGWHLPTKAEMDTLVSFVGGYAIAGKMLGDKTNGTSSSWGWSGDIVEFKTVNGSDEYGFGALTNRFWSSTMDDDESAYYLRLFSRDASAKLMYDHKSDDFYVRCLKGALPNDNIAASKPLSTSVIKDPRDAQVYKTVSIGSQTWLAQNLNYKTGNSSCYADSDENCMRYGRLYTWADAKNACPAGFHLPSLDEWNDLFIAVGGRSLAGRFFKDRTGWMDSIPGLDEYGFSVLSGGYKNFQNYENEGASAWFWSSTNDDKSFNNRAYVFYLQDSVFYRDTIPEEYKLSVRCLMDKMPESKRLEKSGKTKVVKGPSLKDSRDGHIYKTVKIGTQTWMAENLDFKTNNSFCHSDSASECSKFGRFYTWGAAMDSAGIFSKNGEGCAFYKSCRPKYPVRGVCPEGWHLPSLKDWNTLFSAVGGISTAGKMLKSQSGWKLKNGDVNNGTDDYGFTAIPVVYDKKYNGTFNEDNDRALFWSSTPFDNMRNAYFIGLYSENLYVIDRIYDRLRLGIYYDYANLEHGIRVDKLSIRCVMDENGEKSKQKNNKAISKSFKKTGAGSERHHDWGSMTDARDGQTYRTVKIGTQTWMAQNLNYKMNDSDCYGDSSSNCSKYGRLYKWALAMDACPTGWRLPKQTDWDSLFATVGGQSLAGKELKSVEGWFNGENGSDRYGFSVLPAGISSVKTKNYFSSRYDENVFRELGKSAFFWSSTEYDDNSALVMFLRYYADFASYEQIYKSNKFSVRCIKGEPPIANKSKMVEASPIKDSRDGLVYRTVKIGNQTWMAENLNFRTPKSFCYGDSEKNCSTYGRFYTWAETMDSAGVFSKNAERCGDGKNCITTYPVRGICPAGFHLPTRMEWKILMAFVGDSAVAGKVLKSASGWNGRKLGVDDYGFTVLPAGHVSIDYKGESSFRGMEYNASFWSSTEKDFSNVYGGLEFSSDADDADLHNFAKSNYAKNVRCLKDDDGLLPLKSGIATSQSSLKKENGLVRDARDGQTYKTVKIGEQTWMAENLNYEMEYSACKDYYAGNCVKYGRFYTWSAAKEACPAGWHLPTKAEWGELFDTVSQHLAIDLALKSSSGWKNEKNGSDLYGFSALPAGTMFIDSYGTRYKSEGFGVYFWSSTRYDKNDAFSMSLHDERDGGNLLGMNKKAGLNVRCVKD